MMIVFLHRGYIVATCCLEATSWLHFAHNFWSILIDWNLFNRFSSLWLHRGYIWPTSARPGMQDELHRKQERTPSAASCLFGEICSSNSISYRSSGRSAWGKMLVRWSSFFHRFFNNCIFWINTQRFTSSCWYQPQLFLITCFQVERFWNYFWRIALCVVGST